MINKFYTSQANNFPLTQHVKSSMPRFDLSMSYINSRTLNVKDYNCVNKPIVSSFQYLVLILVVT